MSTHTCAFCGEEFSSKPVYWAPPSVERKATRWGLFSIALAPFTAGFSMALLAMAPKGEEFCSKRCCKLYQERHGETDERSSSSGSAGSGCMGKIVGCCVFLAILAGLVAFVDHKLDERKAAKERAERARREASELVDRTIASDEEAAWRRVADLRAEHEKARALRVEALRRAEEAAAAEEARIAEESAKAAAEAEEERRKVEQAGAIRDFALTEAPKTWEALQRLRAEREDRDDALSRILASVGGSPEEAELDEAYAGLVRDRNAAIRRIRSAEKALDGAFRAAVLLKATPGDDEQIRAKESALARAAAALGL